MITRIVRLPVKPDAGKNFEQLFDTIKEKIAAFDGCLSVELHKDVASSDYFTYSLWQSESHLQAYLDSSFFTDVWPNAKKLLHQRANAWSLEKVLNVWKVAKF